MKTCSVPCSLLNALLGLDEGHRIVEIAHRMPPRGPLLDVACDNAVGDRQIVELQMLAVEGFEWRVVYDLCKAYTAQLRPAEVGGGAPDGRSPEAVRSNNGRSNNASGLAAYGRSEPAERRDVVAVTLCDFTLWPDAVPPIPMLSRWSMREEETGAWGLREMRFVFLELPKYPAGDAPATPVERWACFFRTAGRLKSIPPWLSGDPYARALEAARAAGFSPDEWEAYEQAKVAEQDARAGLNLAERQGIEVGRAAGRADGLRAGIESICAVLDLAVTPERRREMAHMSLEAIEGLKDHLVVARRWP